MEKDIINKYLINFRRLFSPFLKKDVSMKIIVYPYENGAIIIMDLDYNSSNNTEFRADSKDISEAMSKTNLFDDPKEASPVLSTKIISQRNRIIIIKGGASELWSEKAAQNDIDNFLSSLKDRDNG